MSLAKRLWYDEATIDQEFEAFKSVCKLWQHINKYTPKPNQ